MLAKKSAPTDHLHYHRDGSLWARGQLIGDKPTGYWEWFRKDGTKLRSGYFTNGEQTGQWTTYDTKGAVYKVTEMKPKSAAAKSIPASKSTRTSIQPEPRRRKKSP